MPKPFTPAWLANDPAACAFLPRRFDDPAARAQTVARAASRSVPAAVLEAIAAWNAGLVPSAARQAHLAALGRPGTVAVVTGQQAGLFLGPLYTVYKAASAVVAARALSAETGHAVVPVFWLQDEDHDFEEIRRVALPGPEGPRWLEGDAVEADPRCPVANRAWSEGITDVVASLAEALQGLPHAATVSQRFGASYRPGASPSCSFAEVLAWLFADDGLVLVDPRDPRLAALARPVHRRAIASAAPIAAALQGRCQQLDRAGFKVQVHVRPGAPLSFYQPQGPQGPRMRLVPHEGDWALVGGGDIISASALEDALNRHPERFSTSALLRPILQDHWLPTAAYVGGPGELAYLAQLGPLYDAFDLPQPMPLLRARFEVVDARARRQLGQLGLASSDLTQSRQALLTAVGGGSDDARAEALEAALVDSVGRALADARPHALALDAQLGKHFDKTQRAIGDFARRLCDRYRRAIATRDGVTAGRLDAALAWFQPQGAPQERVYGLPWFAARFGPMEFLAAVRDAVEPFSPGLRPLDMDSR